MLLFAVPLAQGQQLVSLHGTFTSNGRSLPTCQSKRRVVIEFAKETEVQLEPTAVSRPCHAMPCHAMPCHAQHEVGHTTAGPQSLVTLLIWGHVCCVYLWSPSQCTYSIQVVYSCRLHMQPSQLAQYAYSAAERVCGVLPQCSGLDVPLFRRICCAAGVVAAAAAAPQYNPNGQSTGRRNMASARVMDTTVSACTSISPPKLHIAYCAASGFWAY
jgi:hypothetical protein